jgi:hypothetical protein
VAAGFFLVIRLLSDAQFLAKKRYLAIKYRDQGTTSNIPSFCALQTHSGRGRMHRNNGADPCKVSQAPMKQASCATGMGATRLRNPGDER